MEPDFWMGQWKRDMNPGIPVIPEMFRIFNFWRKMMKMMKAARLYIYFPYGEISNNSFLKNCFTWTYAFLKPRMIVEIFHYLKRE